MNDERMTPAFPVRLCRPLLRQFPFPSAAGGMEKGKFPSKTCPENIGILKLITFNNEVL